MAQLEVTVRRDTLLERFRNEVPEIDGWYADDYMKIQDANGGIFGNPSMDLQRARDMTSRLHYRNEWLRTIEHFFGAGAGGGSTLPGAPAPPVAAGVLQGITAGEIVRGVVVSVAVGWIAGKLLGKKGRHASA